MFLSKKLITHLLLFHIHLICQFLSGVSGSYNSHEYSESEDFSEDFDDEDSVIASSSNTNNNKKSITISKLACHVCHTEENEDCWELNNDDKNHSRNCIKEQTFCQVKRIFYSSTNENGSIILKNVAVKRNCSSICAIGCTTMGSDRTKLHVCTSCCKQDNCNIGSTATKKYAYSFALLFFLTFVLLYQTKKIAIYFDKYG